MVEQERVEQQIRDLLATETRAVPLSNKLFSPGRLFSQLARTEEQRRVVAGSPLFKHAQARLMDLQRQEATDFARAVGQLQPDTDAEGYFVKIERADR